jgi:RHS repeat-associated protein
MVLSFYLKNEYYPFGLQTANSWTRENTTGNNFLANGGTELNTTTGLMDLHYRNYDPALGRMNQVDPVASKYASQTPYNYAFNAPTVMNDPMGDDPFFNREAWRGGANRAVYYNRPKDGGSLAFGGWGAQYNSVANNLGLMSTRQFESFYDVNLSTQEGRDWLQTNTKQNIPLDQGIAMLRHYSAIGNALELVRYIGYWYANKDKAKEAFNIRMSAYTAARYSGPRLNTPFDGGLFLPTVISGNTAMRATVTKGKINFLVDHEQLRTDGIVKGYTEPINESDPTSDITVYIHPSVFTLNLDFIKSVVGHEWIHVAHYRTGAYNDWNKAFKGLGGYISEEKAWRWSKDFYPNATGNNASTPYQVWVAEFMQTPPGYSNSKHYKGYFK